MENRDYSPLAVGSPRSTVCATQQQAEPTHVLVTCGVVSRKAHVCQTAPGGAVLEVGDDGRVHEKRGNQYLAPLAGGQLAVDESQSVTHLGSQRLDVTALKSEPSKGPHECLGRGNVPWPWQECPASCQVERAAVLAEQLLDELSETVPIMPGHLAEPRQRDGTATIRIAERVETVSDEQLQRGTFEI
ncbi:MAG TPA: hypothetical protein VMD59_08290, partial [Acidimicrobiales bacterium]|nr:hypothetical protein [Acidimicrobiales bacterium]